MASDFEAAYASVASGEVQAGVIMVEEEKAGKGWGLVLYDAPVEAVWMAINDQDGVVEGRPVAVSVVVEGPKTGAERLLFQYLEVPIFKDRWWIVQIHHNAPLYEASQGKVWEQHWTYVDDPPRLPGELGVYQDSGIQVAWTKGAWLLVDLGDGKTLAEYFAWTDPGGSVPAGPASRFAVGGIKKVLAGIGELAATEAKRPRTGFVRPDQTPLDEPDAVVQLP